MIERYGNANMGVIGIDPVNSSFTIIIGERTLKPMLKSTGIEKQMKVTLKIMIIQYN